MSGSHNKPTLSGVAVAPFTPILLGHPHDLPPTPNLQALCGGTLHVNFALSPDVKRYANAVAVLFRAAYSSASTP